MTLRNTQAPLSKPKRRKPAPAEAADLSISPPMKSHPAGTNGRKCIGIIIDDYPRHLSPDIIESLVRRPR